MGNTIPIRGRLYGRVATLFRHKRDPQTGRMTDTGKELIVMLRLGANPLVSLRAVSRNQGRVEAEGIAQTLAISTSEKALARVEDYLFRASIPYRFGTLKWGQNSVRVIMVDDWLDYLKGEDVSKITYSVGVLDVFEQKAKHDWARMPIKFYTGWPSSEGLAPLISLTPGEVYYIASLPDLLKGLEDEFPGIMRGETGALESLEEIYDIGSNRRFALILTRLSERLVSIGAYAEVKGGKYLNSGVRIGRYVRGKGEEQGRGYNTRLDFRETGDFMLWLEHVVLAKEFYSSYLRQQQQKRKGGETVSIIDPVKAPYPAVANRISFVRKIDRQGGTEFRSFQFYQSHGGVVMRIATGYDSKNMEGLDRVILNPKVLLADLKQEAALSAYLAVKLDVGALAGTPGAGGSTGAVKTLPATATTNPEDVVEFADSELEQMAQELKEVEATEAMDVDESFVEDPDLSWQDDNDEVEPGALPPEEFMPF